MKLIYIIAIGILVAHSPARAAVGEGHTFKCKTVNFNPDFATLNCDPKKPTLLLRTPRGFMLEDGATRALKANTLVKFTLSDEQFTQWRKLNRKVDQRQFPGAKPVAASAKTVVPDAPDTPAEPSPGATCRFAKTPKSQREFQVVNPEHQIIKVEHCAQPICRHVVVCGSEAKVAICKARNQACDGYDADACLAETADLSADAKFIANPAPVTK